VQLQYLWPSEFCFVTITRLHIREDDLADDNPNKYGANWVYPRNEFVSIEGEENLTFYKMGHGLFLKGFCKICAVPVYNKAVRFSEEERAALPEAGRFWYDRGQVHRSLNAKVIDGVDLTKLKKQRIDGWKNIMPQYENP
jgi:hypothetical protein